MPFSLTPFYDLIQRFDAIWLDSYGVVKNHKGLIRGVPKVIRQIKALGIPVRLLTNDASRSQMRMIESLTKAGLTELHPDEVITSGMMARQHLEFKVNGGKVAYLGTKQAADYILEANCEPVPVAQLKESDYKEVTALVFLDDEGFDWSKSINATINLVRKTNVPGIVANSDKLYPVAKNDVSVATGGIAKLVENVLGRKFIHYGKPDSQMFMYAYETLARDGKFERPNILMVGDTLQTDILGGNKFGVQTALVLSGNTRAKNYAAKIESTGIIPDFVCKSIVK